MGSVKSISTENFTFTIIGVDTNGLSIVEIKPLTASAKDLFRFKKFGRKTQTNMERGSIFGFADDYEGKVMQLAGI